GVSDVWVGFDWKIAKRNNSPDEQNDGEAQHQDTIAERKVDQKTDHFPCPATPLENASALATTSSPAFTVPSCNCWKPSTAVPCARTSSTHTRPWPSLPNSPSFFY